MRSPAIGRAEWALKRTTRTHPFSRAAWCEECVRAAGREKAHARQPSQKKTWGDPVVEMDLGILKTDGFGTLDAAETADTSGQWFLVAADKDTGMLLSVFAESKSQHEFVTAQSREFLAQSVSQESNPRERQRTRNCESWRRSPENCTRDGGAGDNTHFRPCIAGKRGTCRMNRG